MAGAFIAEHGLLVLAVLAAGFAAGFAGGLFGIGGGVVTVPSLYAVFRSFGVNDEAGLKTAIGTSLAVIIVTSLRSLATHHRAGHVDKDILRAWTPWIAFGSAIGGFIARWVPAEALTLVFAAGALYFGLKRIGGEKSFAPNSSGELPGRRIHIPLGIGTGLFSSLMGIGGGAVGVMVMSWAGRPIHKAVGTASGFGVAVAVPGATGFMLAGWGRADLPPLSLGYVNYAAFALMAAMAGFAAPLGARLAHRTGGRLLSTLFGLYVLAAAAALLLDMFVY